MNNITVVEKQINYLEDVVYNGLNPSGTAIGGGGGGDTSDLYYSKTQLDGGQLDNRYYTETELNNGQLNDLYYTKNELDTKFGLYYTKVDLDGGQLDNRYYTETEVDDMLDSFVSVSGTPADNQLAVWTNANTIEGTNDLTFDGIGLKNKLAYLQYSPEVDRTDWRFTISTADADLTKLYNYDEGETAFRNMVLGNSTDLLYLDALNDRVGIGTTSPEAPLHVYYDGNLGLRLESTNDVNIQFESNGANKWMMGYDANPAGFRIYDYSGTPGTRFFIQPSTGNVGINETDPSYKLDVNGDGRFTGNLYCNSNIYQGYNGIHFFGDSNEGQIFNDGSDFYISSRGHGHRIITEGENTEGDNKTMIIADPDNKIELYYAGNAKLETTAAGITVSGITTTNGAIFPSGDIQTDNYVSETTGWKGTYAGAFDVRSLYTDELIAKTFIADIDLALLSGTMVSKSITQVSRNFTVPANGNTGTLYVEAIPGFPDSQAFEDGDWVRLQVVDRTGGGLQWLRVYGTVVAPAGWNDGDGEQHYTFTTQYDGLSHGAIGATVHAGAGAQDLGTSGDGFIQSEAGSYSLNTPYIQTATWTTNPYEGANIKVRTRLGNLTGITGQTGFGFVTRKDNTNYVTQWWNTDSDWGIKGMVAGNTVFQLGNTNKIACLTIESTKLYIGTGTFGNTNTSYYVDDSGQFSLKDNLTWDGTDLAIIGKIQTSLHFGATMLLWGNGIWNDSSQGDSYLSINQVGYEQGYDYYRRLFIGNGKGTDVLVAGGNAAKDKFVDINGEVDITGDLTVSGIANDNQLITTDANGKLISESNLTFDGTDLTLTGALGIVGDFSITGDITGDIAITGDLTCPTILGNTVLTGDLDVDGDIRSTETKYWSCPGISFTTEHPNTDDITVNISGGYIQANEDNIYFICPVLLPNGAVVSAVEVFGNAGAAAETWHLYRYDLTATGVGASLATANINTEDTSIFYATIDNNTYRYFINTSSLDLGDRIYGARIIYTL